MDELSKSKTLGTNELELKKNVFISWAKILYSQGTITIDEYNKAVAEYKRITK